MELNKTSSRMLSLDGFRGIAILLVFLNHINVDPIKLAFPRLAPIFDILFNSGRNGVILFFLLSGYLMSRYYPTVVSWSSFLQKRYTRIFPLFISLVATRSILTHIPQPSLWERVYSLFLPAIIIHVIWKYLWPKVNNRKLLKFIFWIFILLQLGVILINVVWVNHQLPIYFYQHLPKLSRDLIVFATNATLTIPFGIYIAQLDGVYWSLVAEVFFYILYPIIFIPFISRISSKSNIFTTCFVLSLIPLFMGLEFIFAHIWQFKIFDISYFFFFIIGIICAKISQNTHFITKFDQFLKSINSSVLIRFMPVILFFGSFYLLKFLQSSILGDKVLLRLSFGLPLGIVFLFGVLKKNTLSDFLEKKYLVNLGVISYSFYLSHTTIIDGLKTIYHPTNALSNLGFIILIFSLTVTASIILFYLLEKPYLRSKTDLESKNNKTDAEISVKKTLPIVIIISICYFLVVFFTNQSNFNFFSSQHEHPLSVILLPKFDSSQKEIALKDKNTLRIEIVAKENNFGIFTLNILYDKKPINVVSNISQKLDFFIKEKGEKTWYSSSSYIVSEIGNSDQHPFGFPVIKDSQGKQYEIEIRLSDPDLAEFVNIPLKKSSIKTVYLLNKSELLRDPKLFKNLIISKVRSVLDNKDAKKELLFYLPSLLLAIFI